MATPDNPSTGGGMPPAGTPAQARPPRAQVVGIVNVTPDSFSDGGQYLDSGRAIAHAEQLVAEGADWIDIGGESTRPGAAPLSEADELARVRPVIAQLAAKISVPISIDTYKAAVAEVALGEGATVVNDISGGRLDPGLLTVAARHGATLVLGHLRGAPATMQNHIQFGDVVGEVAAELRERVATARERGATRIVVDPGLGFGKRLPENMALLCAGARLEAATGCSVMMGASRKRFIGELTKVEAASERLGGSLAAACLAVLHGAAFVRVHDVAPTVQALRLLAQAP